MTVTILLVEDDVFLAESLADAIESEFGWHVDRRNSLREALVEATAAPSCAVLDIDLGDGKVYPLADRLAAGNVPFVFLSGARPQDVPERFRAAPFISKPCNERTLFRVMKDMIGA